VTFDNDEGSLLIQNGTSSRQVTNGQVQLIASSAGYVAESRAIGCSLGQPVKNSRSESKTRLEPEYFGTLSSTSELSKHLETFVSTSSSYHYLYAAKLHLICLAVFVRIMLLVNYGFIFGEVRYVYFSMLFTRNRMQTTVKKSHVMKLDELNIL
jgi:hypothetical protein